MKINFTSNNRTHVVTSFLLKPSNNQEKSVTISRVGARDGRLQRKIIGLTKKGKCFELRLPHDDNWSLSNQIKNGEHSVFVAHVHPEKGKSKLVGIATVNWWPGSNQNQIDTFEVRSEFRRLGLGHKLLTSVMKCFREDRPLTVWSLPTSLAFFNSAFTDITGIEKEPKDDGIEYTFSPDTIRIAVDRMTARLPHQKFRTNSV